MAPAMAAKGLKFFTGYHVLDLAADAASPNPALRAWLAAMGDHDTVLWLAINKVTRAGGSAYAVSSPEADDFVAAQVRAIADGAHAHGVRVALYPHTAFWLARVDDACASPKKSTAPMSASPSTSATG